MITGEKLPENDVVRSGNFTIRPNPIENVDLVIEDDAMNLMAINFDEVDSLIEALEQVEGSE